MEIHARRSIEVWMMKPIKRATCYNSEDIPIEGRKTLNA
jgi:hypothetical protein